MDTSYFWLTTALVALVAVRVGVLFIMAILADDSEPVPEDDVYDQW